MERVLSILRRPFVDFVCSLLLLPLLGACVGTELHAPSDHPANPRAATGRLAAVSGLREDFDAGHEARAAEHDAAHVRYTCPMHPEVESKEPGSCPKCGMKLVPEKEEP